MRKRFNAPAETLERMREKIIGLGEDSHRKSYYPELQRRIQQLQTGEARFRNLVESVRELIWEADAQGILTYCSPRSREFLGREPAETLGIPLWDLAVPEDQPRLKEAFCDVAGKGGRLRVLECTFRRKDASPVVCEVNIAKLMSGHGGFLGSLHDVTERKHFEAELLQAKEAAETANHAKSEFLTIASHELRTPLTSLRMAIDIGKRLLARGVAVGSHELERMERQAKRLSRMVDDLLEVSRLEHGHFELRFTPLDLREAIQRSIADFSWPSQRRAADLVFECAQEPLPVEADPLRIQQVIDNLLDNATKYSPDEAPIRLRVYREGVVARVSVSDQGTGIPPEIRDRIFSRFFRAPGEAIRQQSGLGIGLYVSKEIVRRHGGNLEVVSEPGRGSTFSFELPLRSQA